MVGADALIGLGGDDTLNGGAGADLLAGGVGDDILSGSTDADRFRLDSGTGTDTVGDDSGADGDVIDVTALFQTMPGGSDVSDYLNYSAGVLSVDFNGAAGGPNFVAVATLVGSPAAGTVTLLFVDTDGVVLSTTADLV